MNFNKMSDRELWAYLFSDFASEIGRDPTIEEMEVIFSDALAERIDQAERQIMADRRLIERFEGKKK